MFTIYLNTHLLKWALHPDSPTLKAPLMDERELRGFIQDAAFDVIEGKRTYATVRIEHLVRLGLLTEMAFGLAKDITHTPPDSSVKPQLRLVKS